MAVAEEMGSNLKALAVLVFLAIGAAANATTYYVSVAGLGGTPEYEAQFAKWNAQLDDLLKKNGPGVTVETVTGGSATRQNLERLFRRLADQIHSDDSFALVLIGHGTFDGTDYKFNIPGPDLTASDLAAMLNRIPAEQQLVVNMTSASGASLAALAKKGRIVITATKSGTEKNVTVFARYWIDALSDPSADTDKNGTVSALEAFRYAESKTAAYFQQEKLLATEHALLSDTGAAPGVRDPKPENGQGVLAATFPVLRPPSELARGASPDKQRLLQRKQQLEARIDRLKYQKAAMPEEQYKQQLTALLLDLARTQAEIDR
jgi:hypothetical protein